MVLNTKSKPITNEADEEYEELAIEEEGQRGEERKGGRGTYTQKGRNVAKLYLTVMPWKRI